MGSSCIYKYNPAYGERPHDTLPALPAGRQAAGRVGQAGNDLTQTEAI